MEDINKYLNGEALYGDDFGAQEIAEWYEDEKEGYANLGAKDAAKYTYGYHAWNIHHAYRHLTWARYPHVMGFGSAYGDELLPIISKIQKITVVDPSDYFVKQTIHGVPSLYVKPSSDGSLPIEDNSFDLITSFGVLHHIPNVSFVVGELARTLKSGGILVLREPIVSMGDWRKPRFGLTKRERGIPIKLLEEIVQSCGFIIMRKSLCGFPLTSRIFRFSEGPYNSQAATLVDALLSRAFAWNTNYHARSVFRRLRPTSVYLILRKK